MKKLSECNDAIIILANLFRSQYVIDYWMAHLDRVQELPIYKREVKHMHKVIRQKVNIYNDALKSMFHPKPGEMNAYEILLDNASELHEEIKQFIYYQEQVYSRLIKKNRLPDGDWMCHLAVSKDLLDVVALMNGCEMALSKTMRTAFASIGSMYTEMPFQQLSDAPCVPTVMGHFARLASRMNMLILNAMGVKNDLTFCIDEQPEVKRTCDIVTQKLLSVFMDYRTISIMFEGYGGKSYREAREIGLKRKEKYDKKQELKAAKAAAKNNK